MSFQMESTVRCSWNVEIDLLLDDGTVQAHHRTHNIVTNTGRQFIAELITPASFTGASFVRHNNEVVRYIGFGIGGNRQTSPLATSTPLSDDYMNLPGNTFSDTDVTINSLERPVQVQEDLWMREISTPGTFPTATSTTFIATFGRLDLNFGGYTQIPLSEIALFKSGANPALPNGSLGSYPGAGGHVIAYDNFPPITKTGLFAIQVSWTFRF